MKLQRTFLTVFFVLCLFSIAQAQAPADFNVQVNLLPSKQAVITIALNESAFIGSSNVYFYGEYLGEDSFWHPQYFGPYESGGLITSVPIVRQDTVNFDGNLMQYDFKYTIDGENQSDTLNPFWHLEKSFIVDFALGVEDVDPGIQLHIYPNPATDMITIQGCNPGSMISIMDLSGKVVLTQLCQADKIVLDISEYIPGIYIVNTDVGKARVARKIIVQ